MTWRVARSLDVLLGQINAAAPRRSKASDGSIGDAAHATRDSDHNPWVLDGPTGVVTARDYTHDPANGVDCEQLYQALVRSRDDRIKYVIWNRTITSGAHDTAPWVRRPYSGTNAHTKHLHLSVRPEKARYDNAAPWAIAPTPTPPQEDDEMKEADFQRIQAIVDAAVANRELGTVDGQKVYWWQVALQQFRDAPAIAAIRADLAAIKARLDSDPAP